MQPFKMSQDTRYKRLRTLVKKGDAQGVMAILDSIPQEYTTIMALKAGEWSIEAGQVNCLRVALDPRWGDSIVDFIVQSRYATPIHWLVEQSHQRSLKPSLGSLDRKGLLSALLEANAKLEDPIHSENPLRQAVENNDLEMTEALLDAGAEKTGLYRSQKTIGHTGYHRIPAFCLAKSIPMVELLLDKGVPYTQATPGNPIGGMGALLMEWAREDEIPRLVEAWVNRGGDVHCLLDSPYGPSMSLGDYVFDSASELNEGPRGPAQDVRHEHLRQRVFRIQEALVLSGISLLTAASSGKTWGELVEEKGSPRLQTMVRLEREVHSSPSGPRVRM